MNNKSMLEKLFGFDSKVTTVKTEIVAGITTFLTMAYIMAVNPSIFSALKDMDNGAVFTATGLAAVIGTLVMAFYAKQPFALAPGMGLNAFFVYTVCLSMGYSWQFAITAIMIEGLLFVVLTLSNIRDLIVNSIPPTMQNAIGAGIGIYIAFIGLQNCGIIVNNDATLISLGDITQGSALLACIGILITAFLMIRKVRGGLLLGILTVTVIGIFTGETHINGVMDTPPSLAPTFMKFEWHNIFTFDMLAVIFTFLFIDMFDTIGTLVGVSTKSGMIDANGKIPGLKKAFMADAVATVAGSCFGASTTTTYVESASGVAVGGRTGLTAFVTAICFVVALFFAPLFTSIPAAATAPVLVLVGMMMLSPITKIPMDDYSEALPAFITIILIPMTYSISDGILLGVISYVVINLCCGYFKKLTPTMYVLAILFILKYIFI